MFRAAVFHVKHCRFFAGRGVRARILWGYYTKSIVQKQRETRSFNSSG